MGKSNDVCCAIWVCLKECQIDGVATVLLKRHRDLRLLDVGSGAVQRRGMKMTVLMAASFRDGVAIAADTLLHDPSTMRCVMNSAKTMLVGGCVGIAQAGSFTGTQSVWKELEKIDPRTVTPASVADLIMGSASKIYAEKVKKGEASMTRYLVAGYNADGVQEIRSVGVDLGKSHCFSGEGHIAAVGTLPNATDIATQAVKDSLKRLTNTFKIDEWVQRVVAAEAAASPEAVGFPATLLLIKPSQVVQAQIEEGKPHNPLLEGLFA